jgi:hypothetical protein
MGSWQMNRAHTRSYAVISYWTAWLKAHYPLEFAAANLRGENDEFKALQLLREMTKERAASEGVSGAEFYRRCNEFAHKVYRPFDLERSAVNWSVSNGELIGGFMSFYGFGETKAAKYVEMRDAGKLEEKHLQELREARNVFADIYPMHSRYGELYDDPGKFSISGPIERIADITDDSEGSLVFLGEMIGKNPRNANEDVLVHKRNGKRYNGPLEMLDLRIRDDTGMVLCRIGRFEFEKMGREIQEKMPEGAHLLIRANFPKGIRFGFVQRWKRLDIEA